MVGNGRASVDALAGKPGDDAGIGRGRGGRQAAHPGRHQRAVKHVSGAECREAGYGGEGQDMLNSLLPARLYKAAFGSRRGHHPVRPGGLAKQACGEPGCRAQSGGRVGHKARVARVRSANTKAAAEAALGTITAPDTSTCSRRNASRIRSPRRSSPTGPMKAAGTPSRAQATAAVAAGPPPASMMLSATKRPSGSGKPDSRAIMSHDASPANTAMEDEEMLFSDSSDY